MTLFNSYDYIISNSYYNHYKNKIYHNIYIYNNLLKQVEIQLDKIHTIFTKCRLNEKIYTIIIMVYISIKKEKRLLQKIQQNIWHHNLLN